MITGIAHVNLTVTPGTLEHAEEFYAKTLGLIPAQVPKLQKGTILWFDIGSSGQQVHITCGPTDPKHSRHPCFKLSSRQDLEEMKKSIYDHHVRGGPSAPMAADKPGDLNSGAKTKEYPERFFVRDYAGNRLEFTI